MNESDPFGDRWAARIRREHERHAGIPDYGYCPGRGPRPDIVPITSATLARQRRVFGRAMTRERTREAQF